MHYNMSHFIPFHTSGNAAIINSMQRLSNMVAMLAAKVEAGGPGGGGGAGAAGGGPGAGVGGGIQGGGMQRKL